VLEEARRLIAQAPERSALRDHLVRHVADRLDVPSDYVTAELGAALMDGGKSHSRNDSALGV
jgi:hypothetical protein